MRECSPLFVHRIPNLVEPFPRRSETSVLPSLLLRTGVVHFLHAWRKRNQETSVATTPIELLIGALCEMQHTSKGECLWVRVVVYCCVGLGPLGVDAKIGDQVCHDIAVQSLRDLPFHSAPDFDDSRHAEARDCFRIHFITENVVDVDLRDAPVGIRSDLLHSCINSCLQAFPESTDLRWRDRVLQLRL
jgi:hypothetical protein